MNQSVIVNQVWYDTINQHSLWIKAIGNDSVSCDILFSRDEGVVSIPFERFTDGTLKLKRTHEGVIHAHPVY